MTGKLLGHFEIRDKLGEGGMGAVYRAYDTKLRRDVAVKILPEGFTQDHVRRQRFEREARAASALNHPNIITVFEIGESDGNPYIVTELIDGQSLRQMLVPRGLPVRKVLDIGAQIADGLAAAHQAAITHRDIKPDNVMVTRDGRAKILDFGLAKADAVSPDDATQTAFASEAGAVMGTVGYMAPEQVRGHKVDPRTDIFSFGALLYELLSGTRPFHRATAADTMSAILKDDPPDLPDGVPSGLKQIVFRCVEKEPLRRFQSAGDLAFALRALGGSSTSSSAITQAVELPKEKPRVPFVLAISASAAGLVLGAITMVALLPPAESTTKDWTYHPVAVELEDETGPLWSPDGKMLAYTRSVDGRSWVFTKSLQSDSSAQITPGEAQFWAPDGTRIYLRLDNALWSVGAAGGTPEKVIDTAFSADITPDGKTIVYLVRQRESKVWAYSLADRKTREVANLVDSEMLGPLRMSPDGRGVAARTVNTQREMGGRTVFIPLDGNQPKDIASSTDYFSFSRWFFGWTPDARHLITTARRRTNGQDTVFEVIDAGTGGSAALASLPAYWVSLTISPDGGRIAATQSTREGDIFLLDGDSGALRPLAESGLVEGSPFWFPASNEIAFTTSSITGQEEIRVVSEGVASRRLIHDEDVNYSVTAPLVSPDGRQVAYDRLGPAGHYAFLAPVAGGQAVRLDREHNDNHVVAWSPDGQYLYYRRQGTREAILRVKPGATLPPEELPDFARASDICFPRDYSFSVFQRGGKIWRANPDGSGATAIYDRGNAAFDLAADGSALYVMQRNGGLFHLLTLDPKTGTERKRIPVNVPRFSHVSDMRLHPDGKKAALTIGRTNGDIWIIDGFRLPPSRWERLLFWK